MPYELTLLLVTLPPVGLGYYAAAWCRRGRIRTVGVSGAGRPASRAAALGIIGGAAAWFLLAVAARHYAETDAPGWPVADWFSHQGKWWIFAAGMLSLLGVLVRDRHPSAGRTRLAGAMVLMVLVIGLTVSRTYPIYRVLPDETRRDARGHLRQTHLTTCGPVSLGNLIEQAYGIPSPSERTLARLAGTTFEGTTTRGLQRAARRLGIAFEPARILSADEVRALQRPALIAISTIPEVRHAVLLLEATAGGARLIDPEYGFGEVDWDWLARVQYGKTLVARQ